MAKASDLLVAALENEGVERIFGIPGEENLDVVESIRNSSIQLVLTRHEQAAAFMAATYGRLTGKPGVCIATLGPGALNFSTGAAYALLGAMPMIMITGQKGILSSRQAQFQIVDVVGVDAAADQAVAPDRLAGDDSDAGARRVPCRAGGAARVRFTWSSPRTSPPRSLRAGAAGPAASGRAAGGERGRARPRGRDDPAGRAAAC